MARRKQHLSPAAVELVAARFRILGEPLRIRILQALQDGEKSVGELVTTVGSTQPNVSKHVRILQEAGLVERRQEGNLVYCRIADPTVFDLCNVVCSTLGERLTQAARLAAELQRGMSTRR
ncbi:MAG TPA: metalloregulator ArsR/SmtB family transcription factor [Thermoanaerobaculia bacterium]|nr:metalloregulator ArsR/SmtB family transcription factor [Thermoanaerobaculia bacterium]